MKHAATIVAFVFAIGCAASREPAPAPEPTHADGWEDVQASGPPTTAVQLRVELRDRRSEMLARCERVVTVLEDRRRTLGSIGAQAATSMVSQVAASIAQSATLNATGEPAPPQPPGRPGVNLQENIRLDSRISSIRAGMHDLATARTDRDVLDALDRLGPRCVEH